MKNGIFRKNFLFLFPVFFLILIPFYADEPKGINKTRFIRPTQQEILQYLSEARKKAAKYGQEKAVLTCHEINVEVFRDRSSRIADTMEFYLHENLKKLPCQWKKECFIQIYFPGGMYREYHSPARIPLVKDSLVIIRSSEILPKVPPEEFFLEISLDRPYRVMRTKITVAKVHDDAVCHGITPPWGKSAPEMKKQGKNVMILSEIPPNLSPDPDQHLRFHVSATTSWQKISEYLRKKKDRNAIPAAPFLKKDASTLKKAEKLFQTAHRTKAGAAVFAAWLNRYGISSFVCAVTKGKTLNYAVPANCFPFELVYIPVQKGISREIWCDCTLPEFGKIRNNMERTVALLLIPGGYSFKKVRTE